MKTTITILIYLLATCYTHSSFPAEEVTAVKREKFQITLGYSITTVDSEVELNAKGSSIKIPINFEDNLDFDSKVNFGWIGGYWRFADRHRIRFEYLPFKRTSKHILEKNIQINDDVIKIGASVKSQLESAVYDIDYMYSIYQRPGLEVAFTGGIYWIQTDFDMDASGFIESANGSGGSFFQADYSNSDRLDAPLPLFGLRIQYEMTPRWNLNIGARYLYVKVGDDRGRIATFLLGTEYFFNERFGVGLSLGSFNLEVETNNSKVEEEWGLDYRGLQAYLIYRH